MALVLSLFISLSASAGSSFIYEGTFQTAEGEPVKTGGMVRIDLVSPTDETCVLYSEEHTVPANDQGYFSIEVGKSARALTPVRTLDQALSNKVPVVCDGGTAFAPAADAQRKIIVQITPTGGSAVKFPAQALAASPYAAQAANVGGFSESNLLRVVNGSAPAAAPTFTVAQANTLVDLASGKLAGIELPAIIGTNKTLRYNGTSWEEFVAVETETDPLVKTFAKTDLPTCVAGEVLSGNGTALSCVAVGANSISSGTIGGSTVINTTGNVTAGTITSATLNTTSIAASSVSSGTITANLVTSGSFTGGSVSVGTVTTTALTASSVSLGTVTANSLTSSAVALNSLYVWNTNNARVGLAVPTSFSNYDLTLPGDNGDSGQMLVTNGSGVLSWQTPAEGSVTSVGLNLPSVFNVTGGPVTTNGTLSATLASQAQNSFWAAPSGLSGTPTFRAIVAADVPALDATKIATGTFTAAQIPTLDAAKITSGTITVPVVSDNLVAARNLVVLDPSLTSGVILTAPVTVGTNLWLALPTTAGTSGQVLQTDGANPATLSWRDVYSDGSLVRAAAGTVAAPGITFTSDTNTGFTLAGTDTLAISTGGTQRLTVNEAGNVAIGAAPDSKRFHIATHGGSGDSDDFVIDALNNNGSAGAFMGRRAMVGIGNTLGSLNADETIAKFTSSAYTGSDGLGTWNNWTDAGNMQMRVESASSGTVSSYIKFETAKNNVLNERLRIDSNGNVGIGITAPVAKLDVSGRIKLASDTTATCTSALEGSQRYNSSTKSMEFCNGSTWIRLALGGCPAGWVHMASGNQQGYCIQMQHNGVKLDEPSARAACRSLNTGGFGKANLCTWDQWQVACYDGAVSDLGPSGGVATSEWISEIATINPYIVDTSTSTTDCSLRAGSAMANLHYYRCCINP